MILWSRSNSKKHGLFSNPSLLFVSNPYFQGRGDSIGGGVVVIVMVRRVHETLTQVRNRLKREQADRTRKRIAELLGEEEQDSEVEEQEEQGSEVQQLLRESRQLLVEVVEERKGTVRVSQSCCYCAVCLVVCIVVVAWTLLMVLVGRQHTNHV
jgi:hypothetical protein